MERRLNVSAVAELYGVSRQTATRYMRQMRHMEKPLMVTESALLEWERSKTIYPKKEVEAWRIPRRRA